MCSAREDAPAVSVALSPRVLMSKSELLTLDLCSHAQLVRTSQAMLSLLIVAYGEEVACFYMHAEQSRHRPVSLTG